MNDISIIKILLVFYILIGNSSLQPLLSKQWRAVVENNRLVQHILGVTTMIVLATILYEGQVDYLNIIFYSLVAYIWFIFSTKMDIHFNIIIIVVLLVAYLYQNSLEVSDNRASSDKNLTEEQKNSIIVDNNKKLVYTTLGVMVLILGGMVLYSKKKEQQYGGGEYSLSRFLLY